MNRKQPRLIKGLIYWRCPNCNRWLRPDKFSKARSTRNRLSIYCIECRRNLSTDIGNINTPAFRNGLKCMSCGIWFVEEHGKPVVCRQCIGYRKYNKKKWIPEAWYPEI